MNAAQSPYQIESFQISVFKSATSTAPATTTLGVFLRSIKHLQKIKCIRRAENKHERNELKKRLPAATISGTFKTRNISGIISYNGLVCMDFDGQDHPEQSPDQIKTILSEIPEVAYAGLSVSGTGIFAIIPTNNRQPERHGELVDLLGGLLINAGLHYDKSCKDICRLRFVSFDDSPYWNPFPQQFDAAQFLATKEITKPRPVFATPQKTGNPTQDKVERFVAQIEAAALDVTNVYNDWIMIGMALASEFGANGENYFLRVSQMNAKFKEEEARKVYKYLVNNVKSIRIGTFFKLLSNHGIK